jgi:3-hydroxymyristoyl/3-hydroxydecanoyl-(acyl carrier protein) dehydratase
MTDIPGHLPHRHPFLLVDRILEREPGVRVVAEALLTAGPGAPPSGPLLLEMLAQAAGFLEPGPLQGREIFLAGIHEARFEAPPLPGDRLRLEVAPAGAFGLLMKVRGTVTCEGRGVCAASLTVRCP